MKTSLRISTLFCLQLATIAQPVQTQSLQGHVPAAVAHLTPVGRLEAARELKLAIGLPLRNKEGLTTRLQRICDPTSPDYHHYLTPAQFAETFGPTEEDYRAVTVFATANGLKVTATHPNRALLDVMGSVSNIEKAFHVTMRTYSHPREKRVFYAPDVEPSLDLATPVLHISGLDVRIVSFRLTIPDRPGILGQIATRLGLLGANILSVDHHRLFLDVPAKGAKLDVTIETRDATHADDIFQALAAAGYQPVRMLSGAALE